MADSTVWVAVLTGATAVLTGWVTSQGNARAARVQVEASGRAQNDSRRREARRTAYLEFIEQAHAVGEMYWRLGDIYMQLTDSTAQQERIDELRTQLRDAFNPLMRLARVISLEGTMSVALVAESVVKAAAEASNALWKISLGEDDTQERYEKARLHFADQLGRFTDAARDAMSKM